jgi:3-methyl-2-oxobutanoate hydroxymethyltransferase
MSAQSDKKQITLSSLKKMKEQGEKFTCLTSYESTLTSKICDAGVDVSACW